ncbi:hypothetical protein Tco_0007775 [Tanacetum coccineum]
MIRYDKEDEDEEEEDHLAPADPAAVGFPVDQDPSDEETEPFETDEVCAGTIPSPPLPIPSPPPSSPTYIEAPLGFRAAGIRQRDTPPSPIHETEIPEICLPLHKRPCHTAPTPRLSMPGTLMSSEFGYGGAKVSRVAWAQSMDASDKATIIEMLAADRRRQKQLIEALKQLEKLQAQMTQFQRQQGPANGLAQPEVSEEAGSSS